MSSSDISKTLISPNSQSNRSLVLVGNQNGVTVIPQPTPLTRLNYFDGKFLRASDLSAEQLYLRRLVDISNQAGGPGVVHGYNLSLAADGDNLNLGPGLAIDPQGRVLLLPEALSIGIQELIDKSRQLKISPSTAPVGNGNFDDCTVVVETLPDSVVQAGNLYLITIAFTEALCGQEDVFGKLCEEACATSTDRPYLVEGIILRAIPLQLQKPLPTSAVVALSQLHLRSRVASSYFEDERQKVANFISGDGLRSDVWCFGAEAAGGLDVPIGIVARAGNATLFLDAWTARRERIDTPPKRYWQWRMAMRPWDVFLAQILQFQCQLSELFKKQPPADGGGDDPCASIINEASDTVNKLASFYQTITERFTLQPLSLAANGSVETPPALEDGLATLLDFQTRLQVLSAATLIPSDRFLVDGGIIELSSAGYLPVTPNSIISVNEQVRRLLGKGVDLRFCIVRPDFVPHALEEAQHMERISLLEGLDDPKNKPKLDVLVPNGEIIEQKLLSPGLGFEVQLDVNNLLFSSDFQDRTTFFANIRQAVNVNPNVRFHGAARVEKLSSGGGALYLAAEFESSIGFVQAATNTNETVTEEAADTTFFNASFRETPRSVNLAAAQPTNPRAGTWISLSCERNVFELKRGDTTNFNARAIVAVDPNAQRLDIELNGVLVITQEARRRTGGEQSLEGRINTAQFSLLNFGNPGSRQTLVDLDVTITLTGNSAIDIILTSQNISIKLIANWDKQPLKVTASIRNTTVFGGDQQQDLIYAAALLKENADVLSADNASHIQALDTLDIVAAALRDVTFAAAKARLLFPPPPPLIDDIVVRGTLDWVLFHRRRDKQCSTDVETPPLKPPQSYHVYNITVLSLGDAESFVRSFEMEGFANFIKAWDDHNLVIKFVGDSAQPLFDFPVAASEWGLLNPGNMNPGKLIGFVFYGARDNDNVALQTNRLRQFESAISEHSMENESTTLRPLVPFPAEALPPDADGIMLFITLNTEKTELLYPFGLELPRDAGFPVPISFPYAESQAENVLKEFVADLRRYIIDQHNIQGIRYIWVGSKINGDSAAEARGNALRDRFIEESLVTNNGSELNVQTAVLSEEHKKGIQQRLGINDLDNIDDVILIELESFVNLSSPVSPNPVEISRIFGSFDDDKKILTIVMDVTNNGDVDVDIDLFYTASICFLVGESFEGTEGTTNYPEDLLVKHGLILDDSSTTQPGETREVRLSVKIKAATWNVPDLTFGQGETIGGLLVFFDEEKNRYVNEINLTLS